MVKLRDKKRVLETDINQAERTLKIEKQIEREAHLIPPEIQKMDLAAVRTNLLSTSQNYTAISEKNSQFNLKLEQVKSNLKVLEKEKSNLAKVQASGNKMKATVDRLNDQAKREGKLDEIIERQEVIIQKL